MTNVFISHSKRDRRLVNTISIALKNIDITPIIEEFIANRRKHPIPYEEIRKNVKISDAVFLFLTDKIMMTEHTKNWVIFEDGLAAAGNKQLFVFERMGLPLKYPIPYLTDYMLFDSESIQHVLKIQHITKKFRTYFSMEEKDTIPPEMRGVVGIVYGIYMLYKMKMKEKLLEKLRVPRLRCSRCKVSFYYHSPEHKIFQCPACRGNELCL